MSIEKERSKLQESVVHFYLRLNGYFGTNFIVHSSVWGSNRTEVDVLAVRHPNSMEPEREVGSDPLLDLVTPRLDILIGEVKSHGKLRFNDGLRSIEALQTCLNRVGALPKDEVKVVATSLAEQLASGTAVTPATVIQGDVRVRCVLFCPECISKSRTQPWFVSGPDIFGYARRCLCPEAPRTACSTAYDFSAWGEYEDIVRFIKNAGDGVELNMSGLYKSVGIGDAGA